MKNIEMIHLLAPSSLILLICGVRMMIDGFREEQALRHKSKPRHEEQP